MFFLGSVADKRGVRNTLLMAFVFLLAGRIIWSAAPYIFPTPGMWSNLHIMTLAGIVLVVIGYGMYQPAAYAGVRQFTSGKTAPMGYAMLYALMNLGGWLPSFFSPIRHKIGISGAYWVYTGLTALAVVGTFLILTRRVEKEAIKRAEKERAEEKAAKAADVTGEKPSVASTPETAAPGTEARIPIHLWSILALIAGSIYFLPTVVRMYVGGILAFAVAALFLVPQWGKPAYRWLANHPLSDGKFFFFIFALIPVQTLFTYNWLILPQYLERAFEGSFVSERFEFFANLNPILIFIAVPMVTALTMKKKVYNMMVIGTFVMAAPAFFLAFGTTLWTLLAYLLVMTIGEAMWQPRFLQFAAEIAPEGRTGAYMGVAQFPWFLTKMIVPLYSGLMIQRYCPADGPRYPEKMWLIFACIAMLSPLILILAKKRVGDMKMKSD